MPKSSPSKSAKKRVKVQNLPAQAKTLTEKEAKKVKGGFVATGVELVIAKKTLSTK
ncbi:MAG: hypothetical protein H7Y30_05460 [Pyrinomonadaceae bacterium]|nr:hypothetical protein [Pyrinomonadaceae bacterium]